MRFSPATLQRPYRIAPAFLTTAASAIPDLVLIAQSASRGRRVLYRSEPTMQYSSLEMLRFQEKEFDFFLPGFSVRSLSTASICCTFESLLLVSVYLQVRVFESSRYHAIPTFQLLYSSFGTELVTLLDQVFPAVKFPQEFYSQFKYLWLSPPSRTRGTAGARGRRRPCGLGGCLRVELEFKVQRYPRCREGCNAGEGGTEKPRGKENQGSASPGSIGIVRVEEHRDNERRNEGGRPGRKKGNRGKLAVPVHARLDARRGDVPGLVLPKFGSGNAPSLEPELEVQVRGVRFSVRGRSNPEPNFH
ncbi:hypothetical protein C8R44DRAFT_747051 [Mycena epipterygia]|nr:hypothetical protein C8R44DRAFT_747051 [Mycena epipterygia]